jgi:hypothetical protein
MTSFSETSLSISTLTASANYDIFGYYTGSALALEALAWTDATTRATALTTQDDIYVKNGDATRRYLGTIRITATTGQCEDSQQNRYVYNLYNQVSRDLFCCPGYNDNNSGTAASVSNTSFAEFTGGGSAGNGTVNFVIGVAGQTIQSEAVATIVTTGVGQGRVGLGYDSTTSALASSYVVADSSGVGLALVSVTPIAGKHSLSILCQSASGAATWYIDSSRIGSAADPKLTYFKSKILN